MTVYIEDLSAQERRLSLQYSPPTNQVLIGHIVKQHEPSSYERADEGLLIGPEGAAEEREGCARSRVSDLASGSETSPWSKGKAIGVAALNCSIGVK